MMEYTVNTYKELNWERVPKAEISTYKWDSGAYKPRSYGQLALLESGELCVRMTSFEANPRATYTRPNSPVCNDSCLEFFAAFNNASNEYVNIELNAKGACCATRRHSTGPVTNIDLIIELPVFTTQVLSDRWSVEFSLTPEQIDGLFPGTQLKSGYSFRGNFYKCGDNTDIPHYGMWNEVVSNTPCFHMPEYFGKIVIA